MALTPEEAWTILCETPDITSPAEYPDHALITMKQLAGFMQRAAPQPVGVPLAEAQKIVVEAIKRMRAAHVGCLDLTMRAEEFLRATKLTAAPQPPAERGRVFKPGDRVRKTTGSSWQGRVVGFYSTALTPVGYAVESEREPGSVQIYPESALVAVPS